jgi:hypothetical protein
MLFFHNKFWFIDVKRSTWHFCIDDKIHSIDYQPKYITIGLFEASENTRQVLARNLITLLNEHGLRNYFFAYV